MIRILKNRRALSTVVTTLIILVVSILLASVLTYFAINVVSTRVQEESLYVSNQHIWVDVTGAAVGSSNGNQQWRTRRSHQQNFRSRTSNAHGRTCSMQQQSRQMILRRFTLYLNTSSSNRSLGLADTAHQQPQV